MGSKRMDSLRDLQRWKCVFEAECKRCGHKSVMTADDLHDRALRLRHRSLDWSSLYAIGSRLRCSKCGGRKVSWGVREG